MSNTPTNFRAVMVSSSTLIREPVADAVLLTAADVARPNRCHANTVKKIADDLQMDILRTARGCRLFTTVQAERITAEIERRRTKAWR